VPGVGAQPGARRLAPPACRGPHVTAPRPLQGSRLRPVA
jgi:hypothetical protein